MISSDEDTGKYALGQEKGEKMAGKTAAAATATEGQAKANHLTEQAVSTKARILTQCHAMEALPVKNFGLKDAASLPSYGRASGIG